MTNKELIAKFRDMADIADASYAFLEYVYENEKFDIKDDEFKINANPNIDLPARWIYADNISLGYEITDKNKTKLSNENHRRIGEPTAYAMAIEARFCKDYIINKPKFNQETQTTEYEPTMINNKIQNFIAKNNDKQQYLYFNDKDYLKQAKHHHLSHRTKNFVNRYELVHHIPNTLSGFSATIFRDLGEFNIATDTRNFENDFLYIIAFRGTELDTKGVLTDALGADAFLATTGVAITQANALELLSKTMFRAIIAHHTLSSNKENTHSYNNNIESNKQENTPQSYQGIKDYFSSNNIKVTLTGHSLGGHLAQVFCLSYPIVIKELYTYNAPGLGGIITSAMIIFLRVLRVIWKLLVKLVKSVAKLFNRNGFTRKVLDKSLKASGYEGDTDNVIRVMEVHKETEIFGELGMNAKKAKRGEHLGIEIHHIESIRAAMKNDNSLKSDWQQFYEPTTSVISDLGIKLGLNEVDKLDYRNTEVLHLINVGKHEHSVTNLAQTLHFYSYLLSCQANAEKYHNYDIAKTLDSLNEFIECLQRLLKPISDKVGDKSSPIVVLIDNLWYVYTMLHRDEAANNQEFIVDNSGLVEALYRLSDKGYKVKILDKKDIEQINTDTCTIAEKRALCQLEPFIFIDKTNRECLTANNYPQIYRYNSSSTKIIHAKGNEMYWNLRKRDMIGFHFDKNVLVASLASS